LRYRLNYAAGLVAVALTAALSLLAPWVLQRVLDDLGHHLTGRRLAFYALGLLGLALIGGTSRFLMRRIVIGTSRHVECDIRDDFVGHIARLPLAYFQRRRTGDLMSRAMNDLEAVRLMIGISVIDVFHTAIVIAFARALRPSLAAAGQGRGRDGRPRGDPHTVAAGLRHSSGRPLCRPVRRCGRGGCTPPCPHGEWRARSSRHA
jgi:ABC-type multidrug transport system fused ATPase/permease subunit